MQTVTTQQAAYLLGLPVRTLNHHVKVDRAPKLAYDSFDPAALIQWYAEHMRAKVREAQSGTSEREARRRIALAKAEEAEMQLQVKRGELVRADDFLSWYGSYIYACKMRILGMGNNLAPRIMGCKTIQEVKKLIDDQAWEALDELSRMPTQEEKRRAKVRAWEKAAKLTKEKQKAMRKAD